MYECKNDSNELRKQLQCIIYPIDTLDNYKYVAVCTFYKGKIVLSKHRLRDTWETQGGHIEENETPYDAAKRELFEESGIVDADIYRVCDYYGYNPYAHSNSTVFVAIVHSFDTLPNFEMKEVRLFDTLPDELTYPNVTPKFFEQTKIFCREQLHIDL